MIAASFAATLTHLSMYDPTIQLQGAVRWGDHVLERFTRRMPSRASPNTSLRCDANGISQPPLTIQRVERCLDDPCLSSSPNSVDSIRKLWPEIRSAACLDTSNTVLKEEEIPFRESDDALPMPSQIAPHEPIPNATSWVAHDDKYSFKSMRWLVSMALYIQPMSPFHGMSLVNKLFLDRDDLLMIHMDAESYDDDAFQYHSTTPWYMNVKKHIVGEIAGVCSSCRLSQLTETTRWIQTSRPRRGALRHLYTHVWFVDTTADVIVFNPTLFRRLVAMSAPLIASPMVQEIETSFDTDQSLDNIDVAEDRGFNYSQHTAKCQHGSLQEPPIVSKLTRTTFEMHPPSEMQSTRFALVDSRVLMQAWSSAWRTAPSNQSRYDWALNRIAWEIGFARETNIHNKMARLDNMASKTTAWQMNVLPILVHKQTDGSLKTKYGSACQEINTLYRDSTRLYETTEDLVELKAIEYDILRSPAMRNLAYDECSWSWWMM